VAGGALLVALGDLGQGAEGGARQCLVAAKLRLQLQQAGQGCGFDAATVLVFQAGAATDDDLQLVPGVQGRQPDDLEQVGEAPVQLLDPLPLLGCRLEQAGQSALFQVGAQQMRQGEMGLGALADMQQGHRVVHVEDIGTVDCDGLGQPAAQLLQDGLPAPLPLADDAHAGDDAQRVHQPQLHPAVRRSLGGLLDMPSDQALHQVGLAAAGWGDQHRGGGMLAVEGQVQALAQPIAEECGLQPAGIAVVPVLGHLAQLLGPVQKLVPTHEAEQLAALPLEGIGVVLDMEIEGDVDQAVPRLGEVRAMVERVFLLRLPLPSQKPLHRLLDKGDQGVSPVEAVGQLDGELLQPGQPEVVAVPDAVAHQGKQALDMVQPALERQGHQLEMEPRFEAEPEQLVHLRAVQGALLVCFDDRLAEGLLGIAVALALHAGAGHEQGL